MRWCSNAILSFGRQRQEGDNFEASLGYIGSPCFKKHTHMRIQGEGKEGKGLRGSRKEEGDTERHTPRETER